MSSRDEKSQAGMAVECVDSHTAGEPTRVVISGLPALNGQTAREQQRDLAARLDGVRQLIVAEPRGHADMFGAVVLEKHDPSSDLGLAFFDNGGYLDMCGHGLIGAVTALAELGALPPRNPFSVDTPAGIVVCRTRPVGELATEVTFVNIPAFVSHLDHPLDMGEKTVGVDVCFGGNFFVLVEAAQLGLDLGAVSLPEVRSLGMQILRAANRAIAVKHPLLEPSNIQLVEFWESLGPHAGRNVVVFGKGQIDRSPCGTGVCARLAALHSRGEIEVGERYQQSGVLGTTFVARITEETTIGNLKGVIPEVTGEGYVTGFNRLVASPVDPFPSGFSL